MKPNRSGPRPRTTRRDPWARPKRAPHSQLPHDCVVLGVDTAQKSGWCLMFRGIYISSGEFDLLRHPEQLEVVCKAALELGRANGGVPAALVYEKPFGGTGQGQYCGAWKCAWSAAGGLKTRFVGVYPSQWRSRVLGRNYSYAERDTARRAERQVALRISGKPLVGNDEAPIAACAVIAWLFSGCDMCASLRRDWLLQCAKHRPYEECAVDYEKLRTCPKETP